MYPLRPLTNVGTYLQGAVSTLIVSTIRAKGKPANFTNPQIRIESEDFSSTILSTTNMTRAPEGYYFYDWEIPSDLTPGLYKATFSASLLDQTFEKVQDLTVIENVWGPVSQQVLASNTESELIVGLYYLIKETQEIPVEDEQAKISSNGLKAMFTFDNWNPFYDKLTIYRNQEPISSGFTIDYDRGEVIFSDALTEFDNITADYNFSWFTAEELLSFMTLALNELNNVPPGTSKNLGSAPALWYPAILYGAAKNVYRRLIHDLSYQQPKLVYGYSGNADGSGTWKDAVDNFRFLKENYEKDFAETSKNAKRNVWPAIGVVVASEFTMPGGRSRWFRYMFKG